MKLADPALLENQCLIDGAWVGRNYRWAPGGAIAAGAAIGVLAVGAAVAWAPPPPQPGLCRCYTDPSQRNGFWDTCP